MEEKSDPDFWNPPGLIRPEVTPLSPHSRVKESTVLARWGSGTVNAAERFISSAPRKSPFRE